MKFLLLLSLVIAAHAHAATRTWTGNGGNNLWSNPNNWSPAGAPQDGDDLRFEKLCAFPVCPAVTVVNDLNNLRAGDLHFADNTSGNVEYVVNGNALRLTGWVLVGEATGDDTPHAIVTLNCALVLEADIQIRVTYGGWGGFPNDGRESHLFLNGPISLNGHDLHIGLEYNQQDSRSRVDISGTISGAGNVSISAGENCTAQFNGAADNTFTGTLTYSGVFDEDKLVFNKTGGAVTHGRIVIGGVCRWQRPHQIGDEATVVVTDDPGTDAGKLYLQGNNETILNLEFEEKDGSGGTEDGLIDTGGGVLTVLSRIGTDSDAGTPVIRGRLDAPSDLMLDINGTQFYGLDIQASISGAGDLTKTGNAAMILSGNNTFTGYLFVDGDSVEPRHANALGSVTRGVQLRGGTLRLINRTISGESLWATTRDGSVLFSLGTATWAGEIHLDRELQIYAENLTHAHAITGTGNISLFGGTITLAGTEQNTFTGTLAVRCELLRLNKPSNVRAFSGSLIVGGSASPLHEVRWANNFQLPPSASITINDNGLLALNNFTDSVSNLTFNGGHVNLAVDSALTLAGTVTSNPTDRTALIDGATGNGSLFLSGLRSFNIGDGSVVGPDLRIDARIAGNGLVKNGAGLLALGGNNVHSGATTINNGILRVDHNNALGGVNTGTVVNDGGTLWLGANADAVPEGLTLNGNGFGGTNGALTAVLAVALNANVFLASPSTVRAESGAQFSINGTVSGTGPFTKGGPGVLTFAGNLANTFSGDTLVNAGTLQLDKPDFIQAVPGNLVVGGVGLRGTTSGTVRHLSHDQIWANVTVNAGSLLDLNGYEEYVLTLTLNGGGDVQTGAGLLTLDGNSNSLTVNPGVQPATSTISGRLGLRTGNHSITVGSFVVPHFGGLELDIPAQIVFFNGLANIHKNGSGEMRLGGPNTFTGVLYVDGGHVVAAHNSALGTTQGSTVVRTNGTLVLAGGITTSEVLILDSAAPIALSSVSGSNTVTTNINLLRAATGIEVQPSDGVLQVRGRVGSVGGLTKLGPGTLQFFGTVANDYAGLTVISNGVIEASRGNLLGQSFRVVPGDLIVGDDSTATTTASLRLLQGGQVAPDADATLHRSGLLDLVSRVAIPNTSARLRTVTGAGRINLGAGTSLTISNDVSFDFDGSISGTGALNKYGLQASMHLTGESTFSGATTIWEGFYRMDGSAPNSPVIVKADGSLRGDGRVGAVTVEAGGTVNPSSAIPGRRGGDLRMSSANFLDGAILGLAFHGPHPTGGNDSLRVDGAVNLNGTRLSSGFQYAPREGDVLTLINKTVAGQVSGAFGGYPAGAQRLLGEIPVVASYTGGDGNDVTFTVTNLALRAAGFRIESGNGNGIIDRDECNLIWLSLQSRRNTALTITHVELRTVSSETSVTIAQADYPSVSPLGTVTNRTPFQLRSTALLQCIGEGVALELQVSVAGEGTFAVPFLLPSGTNCNSSGGGVCESCIVVAGRFTTNTPASNERLFFIGAPSDCLPDKPCPGADPALDLPPARYRTHSFTNSTTNDLCITVQLHFDCTNAPVNALGVAAYLSPFDPSALCANYLGDIGFVGPSEYPPFSFRVPARSNFVVVVTARAEPAGCDESYALEIFGLPCPPPRLHIAKDESRANVLLQWSTAYPGWRLQSTNSLRGPGANAFGPVATAPVIVDSRYTVTNAATQAKQFFRLQR